MTTAIVGVAACVLFGVLAIAGGATGRRGLVVVAKPAATLALLLVMGVPPDGAFGWLIAFGVVLSLAGDIALIGEGDREFLIGTVAFLAAHVCYSAAFVRAIDWDHFPPAALIMVVPSAALVGALWRGAGVMRPAVVVYALAITVMVVTALATLSGRMSPAAARAAALGSLLFYASDSTLAWNRFRRPFAHAGLITLATYWLGQIGIALSARWYG